MKDGDLRIWWIPQIPMSPFYVDILDEQTGWWLCDQLAEYDLFLLENGVRPDYSNAGGVSKFVDGEWHDLEKPE